MSIYSMLYHIIYNRLRRIGRLVRIPGGTINSVDTSTNAVTNIKYSHVLSITNIKLLIVSITAITNMINVTNATTDIHNNNNDNNVTDQGARPRRIRRLLARSSMRVQCSIV